MSFLTLIYAYWQRENFLSLSEISPEWTDNKQGEKLQQSINVHGESYRSVVTTNPWGSQDCILFFMGVRRCRQF
jgi:hypothetical protein